MLCQHLSHLDTCPFLDNLYTHHFQVPGVQFAVISPPGGTLLHGLRGGSRIGLVFRLKLMSKIDILIPSPTHMQYCANHTPGVHINHPPHLAILHPLAHPHASCSCHHLSISINISLTLNSMCVHAVGRILVHCKTHLQVLDSRV